MISTVVLMFAYRHYQVLPPFHPHQLSSMSKKIGFVLAHCFVLLCLPSIYFSFLDQNEIKQALTKVRLYFSENMKIRNYQLFVEMLRWHKIQTWYLFCNIVMNVDRILTKPFLPENAVRNRMCASRIIPGEFLRNNGRSNSRDCRSLFCDNHIVRSNHLFHSERYFIFKDRYKYIIYSS